MPEVLNTTVTGEVSGSLARVMVSVAVVAPASYTTLVSELMLIVCEGGAKLKVPPAPEPDGAEVVTAVVVMPSE